MSTEIWRADRVCVRIEREEYKRLKATFLELACRRSAATLAAEFRRIRFVPYAPVRQQFLQVWRAVNRVRKVAGYAPVPVECVRWKRPILKPFDDANAVESTEGWVYHVKFA